MLKLNLVGNIFAFVLFLGILIALSIFIYRKTNPPISAGLRRLLISLRILTLFLILLILFEPLLSINWNRIQRPIIAVLVDTSASMNLTDSRGSRAQEVQRVLSLPLFKNEDMQFFQFADKLQPLAIDSLLFDGDGTDITNALQVLKEKFEDDYLAAVVLLSDGNYNIGENPVRYAQDYGIPIFPIGIGDPAEQKDVVIAKVVTNQITYANNKVPVDVTIRANGYQGKKIAVNLKKGKVTVDSKFIELTDKAMETNVRLYYVPQKPGYHKYTIQLPALEGELTARNNKKNFYVKVLKSKMKLLVITGGPSFDFSFLKRALSDDQNIDATYFVQKNANQFYQGNFPASREKLKKYDCIILLNFPRRRSPAHVISAIKKVVNVENKPLFFIGGKNVNFYGLNPLKNYLPFNPQISNAPEKLVSFYITAAGMEHPLMRLSEDVMDNQIKWNDLPPIYYSINKVTLNPGGISLLEVDKTGRSRNVLPIIAVRKMNQQKSIAVLGYGIWRWDFLLQGIGKTNEDFKKFIGNAIRWLITREDSKLVRISTDKEIYRSGEKVTFTAETYYEDYRPLDGAELKVTVKGKSKEYEINLNGIGNGKYEGEFDVLEGGDYSYTGQAYYQNRLLGEDRGRFSMEEFSMEFINTKMNEALLQKIAYNSGGKYFTPGDCDTLKNSLKFPPKKILESREYEIWNKLGLLIALIMFLSVEWFIRKKKGML